MSQCTSTMVLMSAPPPSQWYGLDIETDTTINGLDARVAAIVAVAVSTAEEDFVLLGEELNILKDLEELISSLSPGVLITWNGNSFDMPFIAERAARAEVPLGLRFGPLAMRGSPENSWRDACRSLTNLAIILCLRADCSLARSRLTGSSGRCAGTPPLVQHFSSAAISVRLTRQG